ncbi:hemerythrin domain-containing protein [Burkholderia diffusa]|uniref:Hemerythrin HHE cation binding domain-containing protein n=1 Tax=Burkholderia diffusa TaxID=488732 RepID=A0A6P2J713_9BURK|nr:hemerythrin domain-containing protein [Burkholderia diffusa]KAB0662062.1 hemerythrin domain-containing protein [Burkholderia diffusa]MBM2653412.1 hemerythrin domain-containing protein [Burkholderia diffusa]VWB39682.1 hemerythrin HHE cation binding domain-containing protein [Burkholderia diffusa]
MSETIFDALRESHEIQRGLMRRLLRSRPGPDRGTLFEQLRIELGAHEAAEERFLYAPMLMDDRGLHPSRDALADHHRMDEIVDDLRGRDPGSRGWLATARKLSGELHDHLKEEEKIFFQISGKILRDTAKSTLAKRYRNDYRRMHARLADE